MLAWAITIHKCQGLTLDEIVVDMTPAKGQFAPGQAYVFSQVRQRDKLHLVNYAHSQIHVSQHVEKEMAHLWQHTLPKLPSCLFEEMPTEVKLVHLNVCNLKKQIEDIKVDDIMKRANILSLNETHLSGDDHLSVYILILPNDILRIRSD